MLNPSNGSSLLVSAAALLFVPAVTRKQPKKEHKCNLFYRGKIKGT